MYQLAVRRELPALHFLIGGDWGTENFPHSHPYVLELRLQGNQLDAHGFLVDIVEVEKHLTEQVDYYRNKILNDLPEFTGLNPSLEHFARILALALSERIQAKNITMLRVVLWENETAWASFEIDRS
jgi:6-pyruvoyltetrahydropterin/6-carboxytetrahydropterin synthase